MNKALSLIKRTGCSCAVGLNLLCVEVIRAAERLQLFRGFRRYNDFVDVATLLFGK